MAAWFAGDFEGCIELCDTVRRRDHATMRAFALLKARALLRLERSEEALQALQPFSYLASADDESLTARMLTGSALVRCGRHDEGLALLKRAQHEGRESHSTIRSEIALNIALAYYAKRELSHAEDALAQVAIGADIIHARALEYSGWIASARGENERATDRFLSALDRLERCKHYDRFLEANCLRKLAHLAVERLDVATWRIVEERRTRLNWSATGLGWPRFWLAYCAATYASDVEGDAARAAAAARAAQRVAPTPAARVQALCKRAAIMRGAGELLASRDHVEDAATIVHEPGFGDVMTDGDDVMVHLMLAEELAHLGRHEESTVHLGRFRANPPASHVASASNEPSTAAHQRYVEARLHEAAKNAGAAKAAYGEAIQMYSRIGFKRRAVMAALRLANLTGDAALYDYAETQTRHLAPQSWIRRTIAAAAERPVQLTQAQQEIAELICQGKSTPEIARLRGRSEFTIRNHLTKIFERLGVNTREEVAVECVLRGYWKPRPGAWREEEAAG